MGGQRLAALVAALAIHGAASAGSQCYGTVGSGRLENGVSLPREGPNFAAYSSLGASMGRTYVHSTVRDIVLEAYRGTAKAMPDRTFVYGETGWASGGRIRPHRTHQNGTSVDFFVPVLDAAGRSVPLPGGPDNKFGYGIDFDAQGRYKDYRIDFEAIAEHLVQLDAAARRAGSGLALVIFEPAYLPRLFATRHGARLKQLKYLPGQAWVRHDEHYHIDFALPCRVFSTVGNT